MSKEIPLQMDLFTGELVDNRTSTQKRKAKREEGPKQAEMFSQRELAQFGVKANPKLPLSPKTRLELMVEDRRTEEEKEEASWRESLEKNYQMFPEPEPVLENMDPGESIQNSVNPLSVPSSLHLGFGLRICRANC